MKVNMLLFADQYAKGKEIIKYNNLQQLDNNCNKQVCNLSNEAKQDLAKYIHKNYDKMDDAEMKHVVTKCLDMNTIKNILMTFEFNYYNSKPIELTIDKFIIRATNIFDRYQTKVGGFLIEDKKWVIHKFDSKYFNVSENGVLFQNTIDVLDNNDYSTNEYLNKLVSKLNKISTNIEVKLELLEKKKIIYILLWCDLINPDEDSIVGL
jgi:hypothetical protein